jgi:hypothetical protein
MMSSSCNVGRDKLITATMPMCYTLAFFPNSVNPQFSIRFFYNLPQFTAATTSQLRCQSNIAFVVVPNDVQLMLFYVHLLPTICSHTIISFRPCVPFLSFPIRFRDPPGPTRTMNFSSSNISPHAALVLCVRRITVTLRAKRPSP